jgi:NaMN:DMB phosphoribosyltransferase
LKSAYGLRFGLAAGEVVVVAGFVVVVVAGLVAGFSVVVVAGFWFSAVITSVVKSKLSLAWRTMFTPFMLGPD